MIGYYNKRVEINGGFYKGQRGHIREHGTVSAWNRDNDSLYQKNAYVILLDSTEKFTPLIEHDQLTILD